MYETKDQHSELQRAREAQLRTADEIIERIDGVLTRAENLQQRQEATRLRCPVTGAEVSPSC